MKINFTPAFLFSVAILLCSVSHGQTGIGTTTPDPHARLDISVTQQGLLLPRLNAVQLSTLSSTLTSAQTGMLVTDALSGKTIYWNGTGWKDFASVTVAASSPLSVSSTNIISINPGTAKGDLITWDGNNWINMQPAVEHFTSTADNRQPYLTVNYCIALQGVFPSRNSSEPFLTEIEIYSFAFVPRGFAFCNGQLLPINQNQAVFALIGNFYGGDGISNFALPNLQGRVAVHNGNGAGLSGYVLGAKGGTDINTISQ
jgi:microcystin-dependent protein